MTCTYTFKRKDGSTEKIVGQPALKAFLVKGGLAEFLPARELPAFSPRESNVLERIPALAEAAQGIKEGNVTREQYETLVNALKPVTPYADVPTPATVADMQRGLTSDKVERIGVPSETLKAGDPVGLRLDIPAYANQGVWVVAVHEQKAGYGAGTSIGYEGVAAVTEPTFGVVEKGALNIAAGKDKSTIAVMKGNWKPVTPKQATAAAKLAIKSGNWVQVGMDPTRHAYFYDRDSMEPVVSADEAIQIGPLVLAKNPVYGKKSDFAFSKRETETPEFKRFFKDSKVVDENGEPLVVYHTTSADFNAFDTTRRAIGGEGSWFSSIPVKAYGDEGENIMPAYLSLQNPKVSKWGDDVLKKKFIKEGYDGVVQMRDGKIVTAIAFYPTQIKSVTGNVGTFDETNPDIRFQRRQTTTPEFKRFFKDSKVVNVNGEPLVVYHGTAGDFSTFDLFAKSVGVKAEEGGFFFALSPKLAGLFARVAQGKREAGANVTPVYLSVQNPKTLQREDVMRIRDDQWVHDPRKMREQISLAKQEGYDGLLLKKYLEDLTVDNETYIKGEDQWVAFEPTQIKSATGNVGTFNVTNPDIRYQRREGDIGDALQDRVDNDFDALAEEYNSLEGADGGKVLDADIARELSPEYRADRSRASEVHEAVGNFIDKLYAKRVEEIGPNGIVAFMAGGGGAGKSSVQKLLGDRLNAADIVYDGTMSSYDSAKRRVQLALDAGHGVLISYVYREPAEAVKNGVFPRAMQTGRTVPVAALVKGHAGSSEAIRKLQETFGDDPAFEIVAIDNSRGPDGAEVAPLASIPRVNVEGLKERLIDVTNEEYEAGRISGIIIRTTLEGYTPSPGSTATEAAPTEGRRREGVQRRRELGGERDTVSFSPRNIFSQPAPLANWTAPLQTKADDVIYSLQNKQIDTKRVIEAITQSSGKIDNDWNAYLQEELFHGRTAKQTTDFLQTELRPLVEDMQKRNVTLPEFEEYLHNRHAEERNKQIAKVNPRMLDGGSGIDTADAQAYLAGLTPDQRRDFAALAAQVDSINQNTRDLLVNSGLESQDIVDSWEKAYSDYVPLFRDDIDFSTQGAGGMRTGQGYSVKGGASRRAMGSKKAVVDILANIAMQRERTIVRAEKNRVAMSLYGLAVQNPNTDFWLAVDPAGQKDPNRAMADLMTLGISPLDAKNIIEEPKQRYVDPNTGLVAERINPAIRSNPMVLSTRVDGVEKYVFFNANDERSQRMASALKNLDADQLGYITANFIAPATRWFAQVNTQYNPIFGVINFIRDSKGAMFNLSTTSIAGKQKAVAAGVFSAMRGIYQGTRAERKGRPAPTGSYAQLWDEFQQVGGQTGYRDQFVNSEDRAKALQRMLDPASWASSPLGKVFTANGTLKVPMEVARKTAAPLFDWLSDYNQTMENAVRLSAYKVALDNGLSKEEAASIAKNLTVNFNRKGQIATQAGAWYAFFNAAIQGTARLTETLRGPAGKKIIAGGLMIGTAQAFLLAAAGFDDDEPPDFIKERNLVIPVGIGRKYITLPMPLGFNVIPNTSRVMTEWALSGFKNTPKRIGQITSAFLEAFNPIGNSGWSVQTLAPTIVDPIAALAENKDFTGKNIAKKDRSELAPTPGYTRTKDSASWFSKQLSYYMNLATGGTDFKPGLLSPTPDQIDYLIGQATGGVGREVMKIEQSVTGAIKGEEVAPNKMPIVSRFYGDADATTNISGKFYDNLIKLNQHEAEIEGRKKRRESIGSYYQDNPEARLYEKANTAESDIKDLRKRLKELKERNASKESIAIVNTKITSKMKRLNDMVREAEK